MGLHRWGEPLSASSITVPEAITRIRRCGNLYTVLANSEPRLAKTEVASPLLEGAAQAVVLRALLQLAVRNGAVA